jgi:hypothetical protein
MNDNDPLVLYIVFRQSLQLDNNKTAYYAANAVEYLLMRYFTLQVVAVKSNLASLIHDGNLKATTTWLSSNSRKAIVCADDDVWNKLKSEFAVGKDLFCLKSPDEAETETTLVLWPSKHSCIPSYLTELEQLT